jgi:magnesium transporter
MDVHLRLASEFVDAHPGEAAPLLERRAPDEAARLLTDLAPTISAAALTQMLPAAAAERLELMEPAAARAVFIELHADVAARTLRLSSPATRARFMAALGPEIAGPLERILRYPEGTAGALANPFALTVPRDAGVDGARRELESTRNPSLHYYVYVLDRDHSLAGVVDVRDLLRTSQDRPIQAIMRPEVARVTADLDLTGLDAHPGWREWDALPVVERSGAFVGAIKHKTLRRLEARSSDRIGMQPVVRVLIGFGELYWLSLSGLLAGLSTRVPRNPSPGER